MFTFCLFAATNWFGFLASFVWLVLLIVGGFDSAERARGALAELATERPVGKLVGKVVGEVVDEVVGKVVGKGKLVESCLMEAFSSLLSSCFLILFR